jgi:FkbM family methyltransferase
MIKKIEFRNQHIFLDCNSEFLLKRARFNYELEVYDMIDSLDNNSIFVDVGAAEGLFTCYASVKGLKTYAIEPDKMNFDLLSRNVKLNKTQAKLINVGIADKKGTEVLKIGMPFEGGHQKVLENSGRSDLNFNFKTSSIVNIDTLDKIDLLKIDVDGSEERLIKGAKKTLSITKYLIIELLDSQLEILTFLESINFISISKHKIPNNDNLSNFILRNSNL